MLAVSIIDILDTLPNQKISMITSPYTIVHLLASSNSSTTLCQVSTKLMSSTDMIYD